MSNTAKMIRDFKATNPTEQQLEMFYVNAVMPIDKRSMDEILADDPQITVIGFLGNDKLVNHDEFVDVWTSMVKDLWKLAGNDEERAIADDVVSKVSNLASVDFYRTLNKQQASA